jgi:hypothetical protein
MKRDGSDREKHCNKCERHMFTGSESSETPGNDSNHGESTGKDGADVARGIEIDALTAFWLQMVEIALERNESGDGLEVVGVRDRFDSSEGELAD